MMTYQDIIQRLQEARAPYLTSKIFLEARVHNACLDAETEIERLRTALKPFVDFDWFHGENDDVFSDEHVLLSWGRLTTGDLRRARAALNGAGQSAGD